MNIPGFTAGISLYKTKRHYRLGVSASGVSPLGPQDSLAPNAFVTPAGCSIRTGSHYPAEISDCSFLSGGTGKACCDVNGYQGCCGGCWTKPVDSACGECCVAPQRCCEGTCVGKDEPDPCLPGEMCCEGGCIPVTNNPAHCGECGKKCLQYQKCVNSRCCYPQDIIAVIALLLCIPTFGAGCETIYEQLQQEACP